MIQKILTPTRPQPDTLVAIYIIKAYGESRFPGIGNAHIEITPIPPSHSESDLEAAGILLFDLGGGRFDHHGKTPITTCSHLVASYLGIQDDPSLKKLLDYAYRDDTQGKGTISNDPLDRAFGLSGLIAVLNKKYPDNSMYVINAILPLLDAHHDEEYKRVMLFPREIETLTLQGHFFTETIDQRDKKLSVAFIQSDNLSLPGYLRSQIGGKYDVVVQQKPTGHVNILTKPLKRPDLRQLAALIRATESQLRGKNLLLTDQELSANGRINEVPEWYLDPATNSLQNGGAQPGTIPPTQIPWEQFPIICKEGLGLRVFI